MAHELLPHQTRALRYASGKPRIALFMEMRLGKCVVVIRWARERGARRVLVVAPQPTLAGVLNWEGELRREGVTDLTLLHHYDTADRYDRAQWQWRRLIRRPATGWFLINYEALRVTPELLDLSWDAIILDESTRVRNPKAQVTKLLVRRAQHIPNRALLSGLPNPEDMLDYFEQFRILLGDFMGYQSYWACRENLFHQAFEGSYQWLPKRGVRDRVKKFVHQHAFVLTRKQAGVGSKKIYQMRTVALNKPQARAIRELERSYATGEQSTKWAPVVHTWLQKIAGGFTPTERPELMSDAKLKLLEELLTEDFRKESVVVWFHFNHEIEAAYQWLRARHKTLTVEWCHGGIAGKRRVQIQERFQAGTTRVLLIQIALGQFGWNLSKSSTAIYYSNSYEFEDRSQSEDRIIHLTKQDDCLYVDLVTLGSPDEDVIDALQDKKRDARSFTSALAGRIKERFLHAS